MNYCRSFAVALTSLGLLGLTMAWGADPSGSASATASGGAAPAPASAASKPASPANTVAPVSPVAIQRSSGAPVKNSLLLTRNQIADPLSASVIDDAQLATARGGSDTHTNTNNSSGTVTGNVASQLQTGSNNISESAFSNSSGIPIVIQNTGNNVLIQNSTILNLQLTSPK